MISKKDLFSLIFEYENYIKIGNQELKKKFNFSISPLLAKKRNIIPVAGIIDTEHGKLEFSFHGMGCLFKYDNKIVDFDYSFGDFIYKGFDINKLYSFIETTYENNIKYDNYVKIILELENDKLIVKNMNNIDTYDYLIASKG